MQKTCSKNFSDDDCIYFNEDNEACTPDIWGVAGYVDVETTGLNPANDEIIEFAICLFEFNRKTGEISRIVDEYIGLREPGVSISPSAARVNGIRLKDVKGKKLDSDRIESIIDKAEFLIAHNASFDYGFVRRMFKISDQKTWLCSLKGINWKDKGFRSRSLQNLLAAHGIIVNRAHRAEDDVKSALKLLSQTDQNGSPYFLELLQSSKKCSKNLIKD